MEDLNEARSAAPRTLLRKVLIVLAVLGVLGVLALAVFGVQHRQSASAASARLHIEPAATIDAVMTRHFGKYSDRQHGWMYVGKDDRTYVVTVIQQVHLRDQPEGDALYFIASGKALPDEHGYSRGEVHQAFYIHPNPAVPGELEELTRAGASDQVALKPEDVHFERLSDDV